MRFCCVSKAPKRLPVPISRQKDKTREMLLEESRYFDISYFDTLGMDYDGVEYSECFEFIKCIRYRTVDFYNTVDTSILLIAPLICLVFSLLLLGLILKNLKFQLKVNRASVLQFLRISILIFLQTIMLTLIMFLKIPSIDGLYNKELPCFWQDLAVSVTRYIRLYVTLDCLLILNILTDYRRLLLFFIPKRQNHVAPAQRSWMAATSSSPP